MLYRHHCGHTCSEAYTAISIVFWDAVNESKAEEIYTLLTGILPKYGLPTSRKCEKNDRSVCRMYNVVC